MLLLFLSLPFIFSQILTSPTDEPIIYSSNLVTNCCQYLPKDPQLESNNENAMYQILLDCVNSTIFIPNYHSSTSSSTSSSSSSSPKIAIVSYLTPNILKYGTLSATINAIYSYHHQYQFRILTPDTGSEYFPQDQRWNKVKILQDAIDPLTGWAKDCNYIIWLDSDLIFLDLNMNIELIIQQYTTSHILMSEDVDLSLGIANTGFILLKNSKWSYNFLNSWWNNYNKSQGMDQWVLSKLYEDHKEEYQPYIQLLPVDAVNTNFPAWKNQLNHNQILHLAGANRQMRENAFYKGLRNICENVNPVTVTTTTPPTPTCTATARGDQDDQNCSINSKLKIIPRQLGLSREVLAELDSLLPRAQILRRTIQKIQQLEHSSEFGASDVMKLLTELREDWTMHTHRIDISGGLDPDHDEKLLWGYKTLASLLQRNLENNPTSPTRMPDIQAYLNTIYFIITEISTFDTFPISSLSDLINDQLQLLFSIYPYLLELLHDTIDTPSYPYILIYQYKFYKYLINYNLQFLQEQQQQYYSKIFLYFYQLKLLWDEITSTSTNTSTSTSGNNTNYLTIVLSIEETNMNPLYNPYQEMVYDLDYYGYYSCNISYYDHLQYWYNHIHTSSSSSSTNDIIPFDDILFEQIIPVNEIEKNLLQEIYQKFPKNLPERIQDGLQSIEKSLSYYDMIWSSRDYKPSDILSQHIQRLITLTNCYILTLPSLPSSDITNQLNKIQTTLSQATENFSLLSPEDDYSSTTSTGTGIVTSYHKIQQNLHIVTERFRNILFTHQLQSNDERGKQSSNKGKLNRLTRRKLKLDE